MNKLFWSQKFEKHGWQYVVLFVVWILSFLSIVFAKNETIQIIFASHAFVAFCYAIFISYRDDQAHERQIELRYKDQFFSLGAASHMASVVFDKQMLFSEAYIKQLQLSLMVLSQEGPSRSAIEEGGKLARIRMEHRFWLTDEMRENLSNFETRIFKLGLNAAHAERRNAQGQDMSALFSEIDKEFDHLMGLTSNKELRPEEKQGKQHHSADNIISLVQKLLGISELTELRQRIIKHALNEPR